MIIHYRDTDMFLSLIRNRRSIRSFSDIAIEKEKLDLLVEALLRAPSSRGLNPWDFIIVDDRDLLNDLSKTREHGSSFLSNAPLGVIFCADGGVDTWVEDCTIAAVYLKLAAESLGLKSCWSQVRNRQHDDTTTAETYLKNLLHLPENLRIENMVAIGYPAEEKAPHEWSSLHFNKAKYNGYDRIYDFDVKD